MFTHMKVFMSSLMLALSRRERAPMEQPLVRPLRRSRAAGETPSKKGSDKPHRLIVLLCICEEAVVVGAVEVVYLDRFALFPHS